MDVKRIMVLGAGRGQMGLINAIKRDGHKCIVASIDGNYPGLKVADEVCNVDITDLDAVSKAVKKLKIDAITTCCLDTGIAALGYACDQNNLIGLSSKAAKISNDKFLMKTAFMENGVNTARFKRVNSKEDIAEVIDEFDFPMIVKAIDLQGSKGIYIANNEEELYSGFEKTMNDTNKDFCIIEEFIVGEDFGVQALIQNGKIVYMIPTGNIVHLSGTNIPVGHYIPFETEQRIHNEIIKQANLAIKASGLDNCLINLDLIKQGENIYVIEITGRLGANCLPELLSIYYGVDIYSLIYKLAIGENIEEYFLNSVSNMFCYSKMLISEKDSKLKLIINKNDMSNPNIYEITFFVNEGDEVAKFTNSRDCLGQIVVKGNSLKECESFIDSLSSNILFELE